MSGADDRPDMRTRLTDLINAIVWRAPLPRRVRVVLSQFVYRNPPIPQDRVIEALAALEAAGVKAVLIGGWGIDALVGRQLRAHGDLDLLVDDRRLDRAVVALRELGYEPWNRDDSPGPIGDLRVFAAEALRDRALRVVELHAVDLHRLELADGTIGGRSAPCISAEHQLQAQGEVGKAWTKGRRLRQRRNLEAVELALHRGCPGA